MLPWSCLHSLYLNRIGPEGGAAVAKALETNKSLTSIKCVPPPSLHQSSPEKVLSTAADAAVGCFARSLRGNSLGTEGWCAIFGALRDNANSKIESWDLSYQSINPEITKVLAEYISVSTAVRSLKCATTANLNAQASIADGSVALLTVLAFWGVTWQHENELHWSGGQQDARCCPGDQQEHHLA